MNSAEILRVVDAVSAKDVAPNVGPVKLLKFLSFPFLTLPLENFLLQVPPLLDLVKRIETGQMLLHPVDELVQVEDFLGIRVVNVDASAGYDCFCQELLGQIQVVLSFNEIAKSLSSKLEVFGHVKVLVFEVLFQMVFYYLFVEFCAVGLENLVLRFLVAIKVKILAVDITWSCEFVVSLVLLISEIRR